MNRRSFLKSIGGLALAAQAGHLLANETAKAPFRMKFAPHPGQLPTAPKDYLDQLKFAYDLGFRAWEDNGLKKQSPALQEKIGAFMRDNGMSLGVMVISGGQGIHFAKAKPEEIARLEKDMREGVEVAGRTGQTCMTMIPGPRVPNEPLDPQIDGAVDVMRRCCDIVEASGIILVQEPLSHGVQGGAPLLRSFEDGFKLCEKVNRKSCKLLADFYHEGQIGNELLPNAEKVWSQVAYVQYGDVPGRKEPGSGKLDYKAVTQWLYAKGYTGVIGMEHGVSKPGAEGLDVLVSSYRGIDIQG